MTEEVLIDLPRAQSISCPTCKSSNVFIEKNGVAICRECGEIFDFSWNNLVSFADLKQAMYDFASGDNHEEKIAFLTAAKKQRPFWNDKFVDGRLYAEYFNLFVFLKFGPAAGSEHDRQAPTTELPEQREEATVSIPETAPKLPAVSTNGGRKNVSSKPNSLGSGKPGKEAAVCGAQKGVNKPSLQPASPIRNKRGGHNGGQAQVSGG